MKKALATSLMLLFSFSANADWQFEVLKTSVKEKISLTQEYELYTGDTILQDNEKQAPKGFKFAFIEIKATNQDASAPKLISDNFTLHIKNDSFSRVKEDSFLIDYQIKPFPHLNLKKGTHKGTLLFEIPEHIDTTNLMLQYENTQISK